MENITKHLPVDVLPILRRTCKIWNKAMVTEYRKRNVKDFVTMNEHNVRRAIKTLTVCQENPFGNYILMDLPFTAPKVQGFLDKIGRVITHLELELNSDTCLPVAAFRTLILEQIPALVRLDVRDLRSSAIEFWKSKLHSTSSCSSTEDTQEIVPKLPNLKHISIKLDITKASYRTSFILINQLINVAVNLQRIEISNYNVKSNCTHGMLLEALKGKTNDLDKLQQFKSKCRQAMSPKHPQTLVELSSRESTNNKLQLKKFNLNYVNTDCFTNNGLILLNQFLALHAPHLESLTTAALCSNNIMHLPIMSSLKTLKLIAQLTVRSLSLNPIDEDLPRVRFESLSTHFPNLRTLSLGGLHQPWPKTGTDEKSQALQKRWILFTNQLGHHSGITTLDSTLSCDGSYLEDLARNFPNVKVLNIAFVNELLPIVWTAWPRLETMEIEVFKCKKNEIDSWLTGIPIKSLRSLRKSKDSDLKCNWKELLKMSAGISDLPYLHEFKLCFRRGTDADVFMTDVSGYYGFLTNPSLVRISINGCSNFSQECVSAIETSVGIYGHFIPYDKEG